MKSLSLLLLLLYLPCNAHALTMGNCSSVGNALNWDTTNGYTCRTITVTPTWSSLVTGNGFTPTSSSAVVNGMNLVAANAPGFYSNSSEVFRITGGAILLNKTSNSPNAKLYVGANGTTNGISVDMAASNTSGAMNANRADAGTFSYLQVNNGTVGSISTNGTTTSFNTTSDYRLKENVVPLDHAIDRLMSLIPHRFNFKSDKKNTIDGFLAHEVSIAVPEAVTGKKDAVDSGGKIIPQQLDYSKLVPLMVKAIQEQQKEIEELRSK